MLTIAQLRKFVTIRNKSGFNTNLQFQIDCGTAGFDAKDLPDPKKLELQGQTGYQWDIPYKGQEGNGVTAMVEFGQTLYLNINYDADTVDFFDFMKKAEFEKIAA